MNAETTRFQDVLADLVSIRDVILVARSLKFRIDELVDLARRDVRHKGFYLGKFYSLLDEEYEGPWEVLPYAMYRLKWPEVLARAQEHLQRLEEEGGPPTSYKRYLEAVAEAFDDDWAEADLWD